MSREKLAIEKLLPDLFIYQLGAYLQTCAHIELASCALITCLEHDFKADPKIWMHHYSSTRKLNTKDLIKRLRASVEKAEEHGRALQAIHPAGDVPTAHRAVEKVSN